MPILPYIHGEGIIIQIKNEHIRSSVTSFQISFLLLTGPPAISQDSSRNGSSRHAKTSK